MILESIFTESNSLAFKKFNAIFCELAIRESNEHVGSGLGGDSYQFLLFSQLRHVLTINLDSLTVQNGNTILWSEEILLGKTPKELRYELSYLAAQFNNTLYSKRAVIMLAACDDVQALANTSKYKLTGLDAFTHTTIDQEDQFLIGMTNCAIAARKMDAEMWTDADTDALVDVLLQIQPPMFLFCVRKAIQIDRIVKWGLDEHPRMGKLLQIINTIFR